MRPGFVGKNLVFVDNGLGEDRLVVVPGSAIPGYSTCDDLVAREAVNEVRAAVGTIVCTRTPDGALASVKISSIDGKNGLIRATVTIWD
ncbi:hypothetical protein Ato02nite_100900 [Paractinoplanes toevensis]|uniref:Uncharacterized protein n=1 Tax=Paractinoplanes toevensis TaxID=571911 RepID=A0A919WDT1_9ACTN|nr:hypothetical protein Ato02nite_100900 [Actinoplanes toevensis]